MTTDAEWMEYADVRTRMRSCGTALHRFQSDVSFSGYVMLRIGRNITRTLWTETLTMANPPLPPKPRESINTNPGPPPPIPPLPPDLRLQTERYNTPSPYELESPPRFENPLIAPRPHRLDHSIPANVSPFSCLVE